MSLKSRSIKLVTSAFILAAFIGSAAEASIYNATLKGNNPELIESKDITLKSITSVISPDKVKFDYILKNISAKKTNVVVGYKMPGIASDYMSKKLFNDFSVTVNNEKINVNQNRRAILNGKDITDVLKKHGLDVPIDACLRNEDKKFVEKGKALDSKAKRELNASGIDIDNILKGDCWLPWSLEVNFNWTISIDENQESAIQVAYTPSLTSYAIPVLSEKIKQEYCISDEVYKSLSQKVGFGKTYPYFFEESMVPSQSWKGTIDSTKISIESKKVGSYVVSCYSGIERKNDFELNSEQFNITPKEDLKILYLLKN